MHHNPCFNLFILYNNSFDNQGSEINEIKTTLFYVLTYCRLYIYKPQFKIYIHTYIHTYIHITHIYNSITPKTF